MAGSQQRSGAARPAPSRRRRVRALATGALCATALAAPARADLGVRPTPAGVALARSFALAAADLPARFEPVPAEQAQSSLRCPGFSIKLDDLTVNGRDVRAFVERGGPSSFALVASVADVFATPSQASTAFARILRPELLSCLQRGVAALVGAGAAVTRHAFSEESDPWGALAELTARFSGRVGGAAVPIACAVAAARDGRAFALVVSGAVGALPAPSAVALTRAMVRRIPPGKT